MPETHPDPYAAAQRHLHMILDHIGTDDAKRNEIETAFLGSVRSNESGVHFLGDDGQVMIDPVTGKPAHAGLWFKALAERRPHLIQAKAASPVPSAPADYQRRSMTDLFVAARHGDHAAIGELDRRARHGDGTPAKSAPSSSAPTATSAMWAAAARGEPGALETLKKNLSLA